MAFVAGPYTGTYNSLSLGITEEGFDLDQVFFQEIVRGDNLGSGAQDGVYRAGDAFISFVGEEFNLIRTSAVINPYAALGVIGQVGRLATDLAMNITLTVVAGTPAAALGFASLSATKSILAEGFNLKTTLSTRLRKSPLRLQLFPYYSGGNKWFEVA